MGRSGPIWTKLDWNGLYDTDCIEMDRSGLYETDWTKMTQNGPDRPKCCANVIQQENNSKSAFIY